MQLTIDSSQRDELERLSRHSELPHIRVKALALLNCAEGRSNTEVAGIFRVSRGTVAQWCVRYMREGADGLQVKPGRGRPRQADPEELARYVLQSPRNFGIDRTRWTLDLLARTVPSLRGFTRYGVQQALRRAGFSYKRGQPTVHSPDPEYDSKKKLWTGL
jgi:transposase